MTFPRFLAPVCLALGLTVAPALAENTKFPVAAEAVDAGAENAPDLLSGGKAPVADGLSTSPTLAAVPEVKDPTEDPGGFVNDVRAAAKKGWPVMVLMLVVGAVLVARKYVTSLRKPGTRTAAIATAAVTVGTAVIALLSGVANLTEVLTAVAIAVGVIISPHAPDLDGDGKPDA